MRIRSIKYRSNNHTDAIGSDLLESQDDLINGTGGNKKHNVRTRQIFTEQYFNANHETQLEEVSFQNGKVGKDHISGNQVAFMSQKVNHKAGSLYEGGSKLKAILKDNKQNRTSIFQQKHKSLSRCLLGISQTANFQKIKFRLSKFCEPKQMNIFAQRCNFSPTQNNGSQYNCKDAIILGENISYQIDSFQLSVMLVQDDMRKQKCKLQKIRKQITLFSPKIQRQLDSIVKEFKKGLESLNCQLSLGKNQKCSILINWRSVISLKCEQYEQQRRLFFKTEHQLHSVSRIVNNGPDNSEQIDQQDLQNDEQSW